MTNYYNILGLEVDADIKEIKSSYRKLSKKFHPDLNPNDALYHKMFLQIQEAYEVLSDQKLREKYDQILSHVHQPSVAATSTNSSFPVIDNFSVDKDEVAPNEVFTLTWKVTNADFVQIRPLGVFPNEGFESFKFKKLKGQSVNLVIIATNTDTGQSARKHLILQNTKWRPSLLENNHRMHIIYIILRFIFFAIIIGFIIMILIFGVQKVDPMEGVR